MREFLKSDLTEVNSWMTLRIRNPLREESIPKDGLIEEGVAVCYLLRAEAGTCFLELLVTNPEAPAEKRNEAIFRLFRALVEVARGEGYERILAITSHESLVDRLSLVGFSKTNLEVLIQDL